MSAAPAMCRLASDAWHQWVQSDPPGCSSPRTPSAAVRGTTGMLCAASSGADMRLRQSWSAAGRAQSRKAAGSRSGEPHSARAAGGSMPSAFGSARRAAPCIHTFGSALQLTWLPLRGPTPLLPSWKCCGVEVIHAARARGSAARQASTAVNRASTSAPYSEIVVLPAAWVRGLGLGLGLGSVVSGKG